MKIFKDPALKEEVTLLDLGIVKAGEIKEYTFYIYNNIQAELVDLKFKLPHEEITILKSPPKLSYAEKGDLVIRWSPSITLKKGLKTQLEVTGAEIYS